jgi:hypothetical protein
VVGAEMIADAERAEQLDQRFHRMPLAGVFVVMRDLRHRRVRLRVLDLQPRHEHPAVAIDRKRERDRALRGDEREAGVVRDIVRVEEHAT